ncbi:MAG: proton-conducting transporter membrane subunit [Nitrosospira sp.]
MSWLQHLPVLPVVIPLVAGAVMLLFAEPRRATRTFIALSATLANLAVAALLVYMANRGMPEIWPGGIAVYLLGGWEAPFGIVLVADRLSAVMLMLTAVLALASLVYALARWKRMGPHFQSLFQFLIMGVNGAFLTGDLFNLFVFVEVLLAASYGLLLHGLGAARVKAGLHYIVINLAASLVFLIGVALIYGASGTLNMADLAVRVPGLDDGDRILFEAGAAILGVAFLVKAGAWPLNFWLPAAYGAAAAPVAAAFSILTKVGIYALLRLGSLLSASGAPAPFNDGWLFGIGMITLALYRGHAERAATPAVGGVLRHCVSRHAIGGARVGGRGDERRSDILSGQFCVGDRRFFHAERNDRAYPAIWRQRDRRFAGIIRPR